MNHIKISELRVYKYCGVDVRVFIDYKNEIISLVDQLGNTPKNYIFGKRGLDFMNGWINVLEAMQHAIKNASEDLKDYLELKKKENMDDMAIIKWCEEEIEAYKELIKLVKGKI